MVNPSEQQERAFLVGVEFRNRGARTERSVPRILRRARKRRGTTPRVRHRSRLLLHRHLASAAVLPADSPDFSSEESLDELRSLATSAGAEIVGEFTQRKDRPDPATLIGKGKLEEIAGAAASVSADVILFDHDLSPSQQRNIERVLKRE